MSWKCFFGHKPILEKEGEIMRSQIGQPDFRVGWWYKYKCANCTHRWMEKVF